MLQGEPQKARERDEERMPRQQREGDKIKNGCLFIHNFLFIQIAQQPSGQP